VLSQKFLSRIAEPVVIAGQVIRLLGLSHTRPQGPTLPTMTIVGGSAKEGV
jgi:hypothetical protein